MSEKTNPFHELYVTESIGSDSFVELFSDVLVNPCLALFKPGNIVLQGLPGTGKTMMLNLLKPSIRSAYKLCNVTFPVPKKLGRFIGSGINLIRSSVSDFGHRLVSEDSNEIAIYFADFLNYWIVRDILNSIKELSLNLSDEIGIHYSPENLQKFTDQIITDPCWFGYLSNINSFEELTDLLKHRIQNYRSFLQFNIDNIETKICESKTAIGLPVARVVKCLKECGIIDNDVNVYVRIDQFEELTWLDNSKENLGSKFQSIIYKLLSMRDTTVSYKMGVRPFIWKDADHEIFGTSAKLEQDRNYLVISIDDVLRRPEDVKTYLFPKFANSIFEKRLKVNGINIPKDFNGSPLSFVFGTGLDTKKRAGKLFKNSPKNALVLDDTWPKQWNNFLLELCENDPLSAKFGEAWARQKDKKGIVNNIPDITNLPWEAEKKKYWRKERSEQALIQLASRNRQQLIWEGESDVINLSGGNILAFLSICKQIWEIWMRDKSADFIQALSPLISTSIQTLGILETSKTWFDKISRQKGGKDRKRFIEFLGFLMHKKLLEDLSMSYPGHNGFSVKISDLNSQPDVFSFLKEASDYGDLQERPHTTKEKNKSPRMKWYLNPILSPYFKIPPTHTKEPIYIQIEELIGWLNTSVDGTDFQLNKRSRKAGREQNHSGQTSLF